MFFPILGRHLVHSMAIFYTALVCTTMFQSTLLGISAPPITSTEWLSKKAFIHPVPTSTTTEDHSMKRSLALLYPPGIVGGYRNQAMRLIGFLHYAKMKNVEELLLPTMLWTTTYKAAKDEKRFYPVPMSSIFDVEHWNSFSNHLPTLVDSITGGDCWKPNNESLENLTFRNYDPSRKFVSPMAEEILRSSALLTPVRNISTEILTGALNIQTRKLDLLPLVQNCSHPLVYGGGKGAGRLWNDYVRLPKVQPGRKNETDPLAIETTELISVVSKALQPTKKWRDVAHQCVRGHQRNMTSEGAGKDRNKMTPYIALHARVEVDMLIHRCSKNMEKNLSTILDMVESFKEEHEFGFGSEPLQGIFVAVSRRGMLHPTKEDWVQPLLKENWDTLNSSRDRVSRVFECGEDMMNEWYSSQPAIENDYYGSLLPSVLNFYIATKATVFIGVSKSSWSTDVWTTRYYQGKGKSNFEYTPTGIVPVSNGGLPQSHGNCQ